MLGFWAGAIDTVKDAALGYEADCTTFSPLPPPARAAVTRDRESAPKQGE